MDEEYNEYGTYEGEDYNLWEEEQVFQDHEGREDELGEAGSEIDDPNYEDTEPSAGERSELMAKFDVLGRQ